MKDIEAIKLLLPEKKAETYPVIDLRSDAKKERVDFFGGGYNQGVSASAESLSKKVVGVEELTEFMEKKGYGITDKYGVAGEGLATALTKRYWIFEKEGEMTCKEIILEHLKKNGYDGLCNDDCGCLCNNLFLCDSNFEYCVPAYKYLHPEIIGEWLMEPIKRKAK